MSETVRRRGIRAKLALGLAVFLIPAYIIIAYMFWRDIGERREQISIQHAQTAQAVAVAVRAFMDVNLAVLKTVAIDLAGAEADERAAVEGLAQVRALEGRIGAVGILTADGRLGRADPPETPVDRLVPPGSVLDALREGASVRVTDIRDVGGQAGFNIVVPVRRDGLGEPRFLSAWIEDDRLASYLALRIGRSGNLGVLDSSGRAAMLSFIPDIDWEQRDRRFIPSVQQALAGQVATNNGFVDPIDGVRRIGGSAPVQDLGWVTNVFEPEAEALADQQARLLFGFSVLVALTLGAALLMRAAARRMIRPIESMGRASRHIQAGEYSTRVDIDTGDELEALADSFNSMAERVQEVLRGERRVANMVRDSLLPSQFDRVPWLDIGVAKGVASEEYGVGGDFFAVTAMTDGSLGFVLGDVTGKGVEAAASAVRARFLADSLLYQAKRPGEVLAAINEDICKQKPEAGVAPPRFMTVMVGVFDKEEHRFTWASAGHPPPLLCSEDHCGYLALGGMLAGFAPGMTVEEHSVRFAEGDQLMVVTDGVLEARKMVDGKPVLFGAERAKEGLAEYRRADSQEIADSLFDDVKDYSGGLLTDDTVVIVFRGL